MASQIAVQRLNDLVWRLGCPPEQLKNFLSAGYVPQPKQLELHAAARLCDALDGYDQVGFGGARGPGKSHAVFAQVALDDCQRVAGLKALYLRKVAKQAKEQLDDLRQSILRHTPHEYARGTGVITFPNGSRIQIGHFKDEKDVDNYLGMEYDVIAIEEATTLSLSKYKTLRDSNRTSKPGWRPRIYLTTNPGGIGHAWFRERFVTPWRNGNETYTRFIPATVDDNVFIDQDYKRKLEENTGWKLRAYRYGDWDISAGQFFTTWRYDHHTCDPFPIPAHWRKYGAIDYGRNHPQVVRFGAEDGDGNFYIFGGYRQNQWLPPRHAQEIKDVLAHFGLTTKDLYRFVIGGDAFAKRDAPETIADQYKALGIKLQLADMSRIAGADTMLDMLGDPDGGIAPRLKIFRPCVSLIECIPMLEHDPNRPEDVLKVDVDEDGNGGDDEYDCARYLLQSRYSSSSIARG